MCNCAKVDAFAGDCCSHKKFDPTKPVQTRDGRKARIICTDAKLHKDRPIIYLIKGGFGEIWNTCDKDGKAAYPENSLVNVPERVVRYVNMHTSMCLRKNTMNNIAREVDYPVEDFSTVKLTFEDGKLIASEVVR